MSTPTQTYSELKEVRQVLAGISCSKAREIINTTRKKRPEQGVVTISSTETPFDAFKRLVENKIQSAPVIDSTTGKLTGMLDLRDLVSLVVLMEADNKKRRQQQEANSGSTTGTPTRGRSSSPERSASSGTRGRAVSPARSSNYLGQVVSYGFPANATAVDHRPKDFSVKYLAARNRVAIAPVNSNILEVIDILGKTHDAHRVLIIDHAAANSNDTSAEASGKVVDIFSPSDITRLLAALYSKSLTPGSVHAHSSSSSDQKSEGQDATVTAATCDAACVELSKTVGELKMGTSPVLSVTTEDTMLKSLGLMNINKVTGVAVVDELNGRLVTNTSGADLKLYLQRPDPATLHAPILDFLSAVRQSNLNDVAPAVTVQESTPLISVLSKLTATAMHRVFVVERASYTPIAVISVDDVVKLIHKGVPSSRHTRTFNTNITASTTTAPLDTPALVPTSPLPLPTPSTPPRSPGRGRVVVTPPAFREKAEK